MISEEFGCELHHIAGEDNEMADALSQLGTASAEALELEEESYRLRKVYEDNIEVPIKLEVSQKHQQEDATLENNENFSKKEISGIDLMKDCVAIHEKYCKTCQLSKLQKKSYGKLLPKDNTRTMQPWLRVYIDTIGPWEISISEYIKTKKGKSKKVRNKIETIYAVAMLDEATSWPEIIRVADKTSLEVSKVADKDWLCRYPRPKQIVHDNGTEFLSEFQELLASYAIASCSITVENPRPNIAKRMH